MSPPKLGVYVHFPWCVKKCPYCDFNSHPLKGELPALEYLAALQADLAQWSDELDSREIGSVFFGGGTPSLFPPQVFLNLIELLGGPQVEITMEVNPGTAEFHSLPAYLEAGINRLSIGAQSFNDEKLISLGRIHRADETRKAVALARETGYRNVNLDIMYGLPNQSASEALDDLQSALELEPEHLSWYELTLEPKTEFHRRPPPRPQEETMLEIEREGHALLRRHGFERYEVSAWSKAGFQCRHNLNYWEYGDYLGIGAGAHGKLTAAAKNILRTRKPDQPRLYMADPARFESNPVVASARSGEFLMNVLRLPNGVPWPLFEERTGLDREFLEPAWSEGVRQGLLRSDRIATTEFGFRFLDSVLQFFL